MAPNDNYMTLQDSELIARWQAGDEGAFKAIYKKYFIRLRNQAVYKIGKPEVADELVQDVFLSTWQQKDRLHADVLDGYLFVLLKNRIFSYYRKQLSEARRKSGFEQVMQAVSEETTTYDVETKELAAQIQKSLDKLPPQCRTVFLLSRQDRLSNKEIAARLNISVNTVEQHMRRALQLLRGSLNQYEALVLLLVTDGLLH